MMMMIVMNNTFINPYIRCIVETNTNLQACVQRYALPELETTSWFHA